MSVFGWVVIHQHLGDGFDWKLPWADYKTGFGDINSDFWLGLEILHLLSSETSSALLQPLCASPAHQSHGTPSSDQCFCCDVLAPRFRK